MATSGYFWRSVLHTTVHCLRHRALAVLGELGTDGVTQTPSICSPVLSTCKPTVTKRQNSTAVSMSLESETVISYQLPPE